MVVVVEDAVLVVVEDADVVDEDVEDEEDLAGVVDVVDEAEVVLDDGVAACAAVVAELGFAAAVEAVVEDAATRDGDEVTAVLVGDGLSTSSTTSAMIASPAMGNDPRGRIERCMWVASRRTGSPPSGSTTTL